MQRLGRKVGLGNAEGEPSWAELGGGRTQVGAAGRMRASGGGGEPLVPAEIVQDAAGNLQAFGLHDEDPQQAQRIPAPRSLHGRAARRPGPADTGTLCPDPEAGPRRGAEPWGHAPSAGTAQWEAGERALARASPMRHLFIGPWAPIRLQAAQFLLRRPTSRRL